MLSMSIDQVVTLVHEQIEIVSSGSDKKEYEKGKKVAACVKDTASQTRCWVF
jgi:hypothetical protein